MLDWIDAGTVITGLICLWIGFRWGAWTQSLHYYDAVMDPGSDVP